ncbi:pilus assembly protein CpaC [Sphingobium sp. LB126]|uniref:type II and III secretion system protein family protein n=1 Tax=Sphingobium sp. LB126 TaxID=1983755 RepID=UPI000C206538|nr:type II and III secretion system protein family protein [Sphingobium sp. LB126]PJG46973.1 pilus assembly protein CpaC [Sphingobium sp. LB126]
MVPAKSVTRLALAVALAAGVAMPATAQIASIGTNNAAHAGQLDVPLNKSQVLTVDRAFSKALVGNQEIADVLPMTNRSLYVLGKKVGTTSLTLYDSRNMLIAVVDVAVGPDVVTLKRQLSELIPGEEIGARISNDAVVLTGTVSNAAAVDRAVQVAKTYAGGEDKIVNMLSVGASQQVMLEVRFSEVNRQAAKQIGLNHSFTGNRTAGTIGNLAGDSIIPTNNNHTPTILLDGLSDAFGVGTWSYKLGSLNLFSALDALERKGLVKTLAEPTLVALSGETASFLAGGEFPIPVLQGNGGSGTGSGGGGNGITIEFKPFGVSLGFTPTVLSDGIISLSVEPEVSSIDPSASVTVNGLVIPGLLTRRAKTVVELRDGQSFAIAGLLRNDFQDTVRQLPILGSLPIIGTLFRSTGFQKQQTELVMIVTPRLVKPMRAADVELPTDRVGNPHELDLFLMGRTDKAVGINPLDPDAMPPEKKAAPKPVAPAKDAPAPAGATSSGYEL